MTEWAYLALAFALGTGIPVQLAMVASMGRVLNPQAAAWISANGTYSGVAFVLTMAITTGSDSNLPAPFDHVAAAAIATVLAGSLLLATARALPRYFSATGLFATAWLVGFAFLVPRVGVAPVFAASTLGSVSATLLVDHLGAFGSERRLISTERVVGVALVAAGTILVRTAAP